MSQTTDFSGLGLSEQMLEAISAKGFESPSPIQSLAIPALLNNTNDIIAQAQTGTGKTAAFGLPLIEKLSSSKPGVKAIVLVPTRELALQVTEEIISFNYKKLSIAAIYGGASISEQLRRLKRGIDIVVGTPGRVLDHIGRGTLVLKDIEYLVLDEADEMLNMGFIDDIEEIMKGMNDSKRVMLFSATMPARIVSLSKKYMHNTEILKVEAKQLTVDLTNQIYFEVREADKFDALTRIIDIEPDFYGIVFSRTKVGVDQIVHRLAERGYSADGLHGDVSQAQREQILKKFKKKAVNILVATDVAARGIDVNNLSHVINYSLPQDSESYVHRIGRTGRAGNEGTAITFISNAELRQFGFMRKAVGGDIKRETLPTPQDVVATKRTKIKEDIEQIIESENYEDCRGMAQEILEGNDPEIVLSALLRLAFKNELSETNYSEVRSFTVDRRGKARLFISIGRLDGYDARKMVALLKRECGMNDNKLDDIKIMDSYSFVTVPFADAEQVIRQLNAMRQGDRPIAEIAKDSKSDGGGDSEVGLEGNISNGRRRSDGGGSSRRREGGDDRGGARKGRGATQGGGGFGSRAAVGGSRKKKDEIEDRPKSDGGGRFKKDVLDSPKSDGGGRFKKTASDSPKSDGGGRFKKYASDSPKKDGKTRESSRKMNISQSPESEKRPHYERDENGDWFSYFDQKFGDNNSAGASKKPKGNSGSDRGRFGSKAKKR